LFLLCCHFGKGLASCQSVQGKKGDASLFVVLRLTKQEDECKRGQEQEENEKNQKKGEEFKGKKRGEANEIPEKEMRAEVVRSKGQYKKSKENDRQPKWS